jgi:predicted HAD superfamily Cof-like phosphohydrolase
MNVFQDQAKFMEACGQTTDKLNADQLSLYMKLIVEEMEELLEGYGKRDEVETFDAILDIIVVCIGFGLSAGWDMTAGWKEVVRSNMAKIDPVTGLVKRREDGKILKPEGWTAPDLEKILGEPQ